MMEQYFGLERARSPPPLVDATAAGIAAADAEELLEAYGQVRYEPFDMENVILREIRPPRMEIVRDPAALRFFREIVEAQHTIPAARNPIPEDFVLPPKPASADDQPDAPNDEKRCSICLIKKSSILARPCGHRFACAWCMHELKEQRMENRCPLCRAELACVESVSD